MGEAILTIEGPRGPGDRFPHERVQLGAALLRVCLLGAATAGVVLRHGFHAPPLPDAPSLSIEAALLLGYALEVFLGPRRGRKPTPETRVTLLDDLLLSLAGVGLLAVVSGWAAGGRLFELAIVLLLLGELWTLNVAVSRRLRQPGILLPLSFLMLIAVATVLLLLPRAAAPGQPIGLLDALFTATSAVCVTGLITVDTATAWSPFGQAVIGVFIQLGGLGIIVFGTMLATLLGSRLSLRQDLGLREMLNEEPLTQVTSMVRFLVVVTLLIELVAALVMLPMWDGDLTLQQRAGLSAFHAVSAFCNAGFALFTDSVIAYRHDALVHLVLVPLIVVGGIGFPVLFDTWRLVWLRAARSRWSPMRKRLRGLTREQRVRMLPHQRLSLNTRVVVTTTAALYVGGALLLAVGQLLPYALPAPSEGAAASHVGAQPLTAARVGGILADASFMSVTSRTAGFNSMPMDEISPAGQFVVMSLMFVGGSSGGTAGGAKTATFALLVLSVWATMRQRGEAEAFGRQIADSLVRKAATVAACYVLLIGLGTLLLSYSEPFNFIAILFESVSASTTTGLSLGITSELSGFGKVVVILQMFLGRVGPLTLLGAVMLGVQRRPYRYPHEGVLIG